MIKNKFIKTNLYYLTSQINKLNWFFEISDYLKCFQYNFNETDFSISEYIYFNEFNNKLINKRTDESIVEELIELKTQSGCFKKNFDLSHLCFNKLNNIKIDEPLINSDDYSDDDNNNINILENKYNFSNPLESKKCNIIKNDFTIDIENIFLKINDYGLNKIELSNYEDIESDYSNKLIYNFDTETELDEDRQMDFKYKPHKFFLKNREMLAYHLNISTKNTKKFSKMIKNLIRRPTFTFLYKFELSLISILQRSNFFFNKIDTRFFIKAGCVFVNGFVIKDITYTLKSDDRINIIIDDCYFSYYKESLNNMNILITKYSNYNFIINQKRLDSSKQPKTHEPSWLKNLLYFREDIPNFLEIDFLTLSILIIYNPTVFEFDIINLKYINIFQQRLYNWRFVN